jgi:hypothetical protein
MKTLKLALVAVVIAFAAVSIARADGITEKPRFGKVTYMWLQEAKENPGLVMAIYAQLNLDKLVPLVGKIFYGEVIYHGQLYRIRAGFGSWIGFFEHRVNPTMHPKLEMRAIE